MSRRVFIVAVALLSGLTVASAVAQSRSSVSNQPIMLGADHGGATNSGFNLRGRVEIIQGQNRLRANAIQGAGDGDGLQTVTATGDVYYVTPTETIRGDRAVYTLSNATIVVTGDVILTQGENVLTGGSLTYNVDTGAAEMSGGAGRIRGVFYPNSNRN